jgi:hypothetical protein
MHITRSGTQPSTKGPIDYFTGAVRVDYLFSQRTPSSGVMSSANFFRSRK